MYLTFSPPAYSPCLPLYPLQSSQKPEVQTTLLTHISYCSSHWQLGPLVRGLQRVVPIPIRDFPGGASDNLAANAGGARSTGLIPELGRSPEGMATYYGTLAWRIPWTEEPAGTQSIGLQRV